ncbi:hypothetical protein TDB9533_02057 [Thalassocella blandensis]|nr:hypothetical protein TDB9533_02057 [Thalassocella blandensis]
MAEELDPNNLIDMDSLMMLKELLGEKFVELIETYLRDSAARIEKLKVALEAGDIETAKHEVHGLKGSSRNIGINSLADTCDILEKQTHAGTVTNEEQQLAAIEQNFAAVAVKLKTFIE